MSKLNNSVLIYIASGMPNDKEVKQIEEIGKPFALRNAQFFRETEHYDEVYNLSGFDSVDKAYGDRIVKVSKPAPAPKAEEESAEEPKPKAPAKPRGRAPKSES